MKRQPIVTVGLLMLFGCWVQGSALAQTPPPGPAALDAVVRELRLLREMLGKQSNTTARVQLLVGRLALQDQRTARARQAVEKLEGEVANLQRQRDHLQTNAREKAHQLEQATDPEQRQHLEAESRMARAGLADTQRDLSEVEARVIQARQAVDVEAAHDDELDRLLRDLDKQLQSGP